jgi:hypothetical protein
LTGDYLSILFALAPILLDSPNISGQNVNTVVPSRRGSFISEMLDIYKQAVRSRYNDANSASSLSFLALRVYLFFAGAIAA